MPMLSLELLKETLKYDPKTGQFTRLKFASHKGDIGRLAGSPEGRGYWAIRLPGGRYKAHRLAWFYMTGEWPDEQIDHINHDRRDNSWANLRKVTGSQNQENRKLLRKDGTFVGVSLCKHSGSWRATIKKSGKQVHIGCFGTPVDAHRAYVAAKKNIQTHYSLLGAV